MALYPYHPVIIFITYYHHQRHGRRRHLGSHKFMRKERNRKKKKTSCTKCVGTRIVMVAQIFHQNFRYFISVLPIASSCVTFLSHTSFPTNPAAIRPVSLWLRLLLPMFPNFLVKNARRRNRKTSHLFTVCIYDKFSPLYFVRAPSTYILNGRTNARIHSPTNRFHVTHLVDHRFGTQTKWLKNLLSGRNVTKLLHRKWFQMPSVYNDFAKNAPLDAGWLWNTICTICYTTAFEISMVAPIFHRTADVMKIQSK